MISITKLKHIEIFSNLSDNELAALLPVIQERNYNSGEIILSHCEVSSNTYFLFSGSVRSATYSSTGKEICFQNLTQGEMFGELSAIDNLPRTASIIAQQNCSIGIIESLQLWKLMEEYPTIMAGVLKRLTSLVRALSSRVYEYGALGSRERTRAEILRLARKHMTDDKNAVITKIPTHENIANRIASHREAVTKEFSYLTKIGMIERKGSTVFVPDVDALSAMLVENIA